MNREFHHAYTVRYDDGDGDGFLTPAAFIRYMQDVAGLDAEDAQLSGAGYWVVKRTTISFASPIPVHCRLDLKTFGMRFTRITALRGYEASITTEEPAISARTLWVYVDAHGRPIRLPERTAQIWLPDGPLPPAPDAPLPTFPQGTPSRVTYPVRYSDTDRMNHMNNAAYVDALDNAAWETYKDAGIQPDAATMHALTYDIEYVESARFGEDLEILSWFDPFPSTGKEFARFQQIQRAGTVLVRAHSRWRWTTS